MNSYITRENDWGNIEYKIAIIDMTLQKKKKYATQLKFRVIEGRGNAVYMLGVKDNGKIVGIPKKDKNYTIDIMNDVCREVECKLSETKIIKLNNDFLLFVFKIEALFSLDNIMFIDS